MNTIQSRGVRFVLPALLLAGAVCLIHPDTLRLAIGFGALALILFLVVLRSLVTPACRSCGSKNCNHWQHPVLGHPIMAPLTDLIDSFPEVIRAAEDARARAHLETLVSEKFGALDFRLAFCQVAELYPNAATAILVRFPSRATRSLYPPDLAPILQHGAKESRTVAIQALARIRDSACDRFNHFG